MAKYMLFIFGGVPDGLVGSPEADAENARWYAKTNELRAEGILMFEDALQPPSTATTVSQDSGEPVITEGPFLDTKDPLIGFYVIDVPDRDAALKRAAAMPNLVHGGSVEIRPVMTFDD
ncbi:MAG: YciI family protein [Actinobacteria bacterium]|nr:YciI family protein [Actinomycetota bacterium]